MVTSLYMMLMTKNKRNIDVEKYYNDIHNQNIENIDINMMKCRVCLQEGGISIFGYENASDITNFLRFFINLDIEDDMYPKTLCSTCLKFIKTAIVFQKIAKRSDDLLKNSVKKETLIDDEFSHNFYDDSLMKVPSPAWEDKIKARPLKKQKRKVSTKIQCKICNKMINRSYCKEHMTMHDPDHHKYICDVCGKTFRLRCAYHNHSLRHRKDFSFKCQFCPYKARYAELLKTHLKTHTGDYRYMCNECPARFLFKSNLNSHMFKHKEPQFKCTCKRAFHTKILLQKHIDADHLGIKNHICNICGKAFGYRNAMTKHQRHVHKREKLNFSRMPTYMQAESKNIV